MNSIDLISFISSIASLILSVGAIWLSVVFYRMSTDAAKATTEAAKDIAAAVTRLEKLFDKLYSDTFSMMRDTVSDMRRHIWPADGPVQDRTFEEVEKKADEKIENLRHAVEDQLSSILQGQKVADDRFMSLRQEMRHLIDRAITGSRLAETEAREETIREHIFRELRTSRRVRPRTRLLDLVERLCPAIPPTRLFNELLRMKEEELIVMDSEEMVPDTQVWLASLPSSKKKNGDGGRDASHSSGV